MRLKLADFQIVQHDRGCLKLILKITLTYFYLYGKLNMNSYESHSNSRMFAKKLASSEHLSFMTRVEEVLQNMKCKQQHYSSNALHSLQCYGGVSLWAPFKRHLWENFLYCTVSVLLYVLESHVSYYVFFSCKHAFCAFNPFQTIFLVS